jgi:hypothetical protein
MRIDDNVGAHAGAANKRHVLVWPRKAEYTLLPVPTAEFVASRWVSVVQHLQTYALNRPG